MGMDVYGVDPKTEDGEYFRRNVWGWHPLWEYVENQHPEIANLVEHAHSNDGDGLDAESSVRLAELLMNDYNSGIALEYCTNRNKELAELPKEPCTYCEQTGVRDYKEDGNFSTCNSCEGKGEREAFATWYSLEHEDIRDFAKFLYDCGGFEIC